MGAMSTARCLTLHPNPYIYCTPHTLHPEPYVPPPAPYTLYFERVALNPDLDPAL